MAKGKPATAAEKAHDKPTVTVRAFQAHSYNGTDYAIGDEYELDAELVNSLIAQGKAGPVEAPPAPKAPANEPKPDTSVKPMTTANFGLPETTAPGVTEKAVALPRAKPIAKAIAKPKGTKRR